MIEVQALKEKGHYKTFHIQGPQAYKDISREHFVPGMCFNMNDSV